VKDTGDLTTARELHERLIEAHVEAKAELFILGEYRKRIETLKKTGMIEILSTGDFGIIGIDGKEYKVPTYSEIATQMLLEIHLVDHAHGT